MGKAFSAGKLARWQRPSVAIDQNPPQPDALHVEPQIKQLSHWMDTKFRVPILGWRFGLDALLGLIPGIGDTVSSLVSVYIMSLAAKARVPRITLVRMGLNVAIDFVVGMIPVLGDLFDVWFKSNQRNVELLERRLAAGPAELRSARRSDWLFVLLIVVVLLGLLVGTVWLSLYLLSVVIETIRGWF